MTAVVYPLAKQVALGAGLNLGSANVKVLLLSSAYTYSGAHQFLSDVSAGSIAVSSNLSSLSITNGTFNAAGTTLTAVASGSTVVAMLGYIDTGTGSTSNLLWFEDGFSLVTNGGNIVITWDTGADKIFVI